MKHVICSELSQREKADFLVLPFWEGGEPAGEFSNLKSAYERALPDFQGKKGENLIVYAQGEKEPRLLLLGLGKKEQANGELFRRCYANAVRTALGKKGKVLSLVVLKNWIKEIAEGIFLANYNFDRLKSEASLKERPSILLDQVNWIGIDSGKKKEIQKAEAISAGVYFVRDLVNDNADTVTPQKLAEVALALGSPIKVTVFDKKWLQEQKMGLILAVNRASNLDPCLIQAAYQGNPASKEQIVLVGKGITYDTGGLSLKPTDGMLTMKCDMAGAATVLGAVRTAAALGLRVNVTALVPATENSIGSKSYKLGDVYRSYSGKTVEVLNTDAEGRLVLADALSYAVEKLHPTSLIDVATLTGGIVVALGEEIAGFFSNDDALSKQLLESSENTGELLWRMPLHLDYKENLKSDFGDLINTGNKDASAMKGALFLHEFIGSAKWAHLDIAGTAFWTKPKHYHPTRATGFGVRLLIDFLEGRSL